MGGIFMYKLVVVGMTLDGFIYYSFDCMKNCKAGKCRYRSDRHERRITRMNKAYLCLSLLLAVSLSACGKSNTTPSPPAASGTPAATSSGATSTVDAQAVFKANCVSCHGANLEGMVGPNLQKVGGKYSKDQIVAIITNGRGGMPSFKAKLSNDEINAVAAWLANKK
jgi:cytochrome c551